MSSYADLIPTSVHGNYTPTVIRPWTTLSLTNGTNLQEHPIVSPFKIYTEHTHFSSSPLFHPGVLLQRPMAMSLLLLLYPSMQNAPCKT